MIRKMKNNNDNKNKQVRGAKNGASTPPSSQNGRRHASSPAQEKHQGSRWTKQPSNAQTKIWTDKENEGNHNLPLCHYHFEWTRVNLMKLGSSEPIPPNLTWMNRNLPGHLIKPRIFGKVWSLDKGPLSGQLRVTPGQNYKFSRLDRRSLKYQTFLLKVKR